MSFLRFALASIALIVTASPAHAAPRHLRVGAGCTYATIQAALDAERANPGSPADFIWIADNQSYTAQDIQVHDQNVFLYGGVSDCVDSSIGGTTTLSGSGGAAKSVMTVSGHSQVWLGGLKVTQGDNTSSGVGGGINFVGTGKLTIGSSMITNNHAGYGGGINFNGTGGEDDVAELWINYETLITNNIADTSGGGIRVEGNATLRVTDAQVWIAQNHADGGYGGGVLVIGPAKADLGSPGYQLIEYLGLLYANTAKYGGGLAVSAGSGDFQDASVSVFTTDPAHPLTIEGNVASQDGGGVYVRSDDSLIYQGASDLCIGGYRITGNTAKEGTAIYAINYNNPRQSRVYARRNCGAAELGAVVCTAANCNRIDGNVASDISNNATDGLTILLHSASELYADHMRVEDNHGGHALRALSGDNWPTVAELTSCLIDGNYVTGDLVTADAQTQVSIASSTIGYNGIGTGLVVRSGGILGLFRDIFAQGQTTTLAYTGGNPDNLTIDYVLSMEVASLAQGTHLVQADPSFINPGHDYRLLPTSIAIDVAPALASDGSDLDGNPRDQDIASVPNLDGVRDLGAYERQVRYCGAADTVFCSTFDYD